MTRLSWIVYILLMVGAGCICFTFEMGGVGAFIAYIVIGLSSFYYIRGFTRMFTDKEPDEEKDKQNITIVFNFKQED